LAVEIKLEIKVKVFASARNGGCYDGKMLAGGQSERQADMREKGLVGCYAINEKFFFQETLKKKKKNARSEENTS